MRPRSVIRRWLLVLSLSVCAAALPACGVEEGPSLAVWRRTPTGAERLADGAQARAGDVVQVVVDPADLVQGAVLSVDGRGVVTEHAGPGPLRAGPLDRAFELDDAPRFERFVLVPGDAAAVASAREALAAGREVGVAAFELRKP